MGNMAGVRKRPIIGRPAICYESNPDRPGKPGRGRKDQQLPSKSTSLPPASEDAVRTRAYLMWEADGRPDGRADHYWNLASAAVKGEAVPAKSKRAAAKSDVPEKKAKSKAGKAGPVAKARKTKA